MTLDEADRGQEVACAPLGIFFRALARKGLSAQALGEGTGVAPDRLLDPTARIAWEAYLRFLANAAKVFSDEELVQIGREACAGTWRGPRGRLARLWYRPHELYARLASVRVAPLPLPSTQRVSVAVEAGTVRVEMDMEPGYEPSAAHDLWCRGLFEAVPTMVGLPLASVTAIRLARSVRFDIEPRAAAGWFAGLRRAATCPFTTRASLAELREVNAKLERRTRQLEVQQAEQRRVEGAFQSQQSRLRVATEQLPAVLWTTDRALRFTSSTGAALRRLGLQKGQVVGLTIQEYFQSDDPHFLPVAAHHKALGGEAANYDFEWEGSTFQTHLEPLHDDQGQIVGTIGVALDVTERVKLEDQVRASQKMEAMGTLAGGIAHDFNNILASILGNTQLCLADVEEGSVVHDNLREIFKAGTRAKDLVGQILQFSRGSERRREVIQLQDVVDDALRFMRASLPTTVQIHRRLGEDFVQVSADTGQIYQVVVNLCGNAAWAMEPGGGALTVAVDEVEVDAELAQSVVGLRVGAYGRIAVSDEGRGMAPAVVERIFDPFFTTKPAGQGTGMGLAVVYGIVASHGGAVAVDTTEGIGTTVTVYLPRQASTGESAPAGCVDLPRGSGRILFVDDEQSIVRVGRQMLEFLGYEVVSCESSAEALATFEREPDDFALVITDQSMPDLPGDALARRILARRPDVPVVLCTGYSGRITETQAKAMGIREYLTKPILLEKLAEVVHDVLQSARV